MTAGNGHGEDAVRALMTDVELPPSSVDIGRAVRTARRQDRRLRVGGATMVILAVGTTSGAVAVGIGGGHGPERHVATPGCTTTVTTLDARGVNSYNLRVRGGDPSGRYLVGTSYQENRGGYTIRGVLWKDGTAHLFDVPSSAKNAITVATDVNSKGVVVGGDLSEAERTGVWTWQDGQTRKLPPAPGYNFYKDVRINERGDVTATASKIDGASPRLSGQSVAVVWPAEALDQPRVLRGPGWVRVTGLADDGTVLGLVGDDQLVRTGKPYVWTPDGQARALALPTGWRWGASVAVQDGHIVGYVIGEAKADGTQFASSVIAPARWSPRGDTVEVGEAVRETGVNITESGWLAVPGAGDAGGGRASALLLLSLDGRRWLDYPADSNLVAFEVAWVGVDGSAVAAMAVRDPASYPPNPSGDPRAVAPDPRERPVVWRC